MDFLEHLFSIIEERVRKKPPGSYTAELANKGLGFATRKFGEEAVEFMVASLEEDKSSVIYEAADVVYHMMVVLALRGVSWEDVVKELERRAGARGRQVDGHDS